MIKVTRVKLDREGYTSDGIYFGVGLPLYACTGENIYGIVTTRLTRAFDRLDAKRRMAESGLK